MKKILTIIRSLDKGTILRTVLQILVYANQIVAVLGQTSFASSPVYQWITFGLTLVITAVSYWYNNDWTNGALLVRDLFDMLKDGKVTSEEIEEFIARHKKEKSNEETSK